MPPKCPKCGRYLNSSRERSAGECGACSFAALTPEQRDAVNNLVGAAWTGSNTAKIERLVDGALDALKPTE